MFPRPLPFFLGASLLFAPALSAQADTDHGVILPDAGVQSLQVGGQLRYRVDQRNPVRPVAGVPSASSQFGRFRLHLDAQMENGVQAFLELQETIDAVGDGQGTLASGSVHQAYGKLENIWEGLDAQIGRFELSYGNQRMVSPLNWSNTGRAWDGIRLSRKGEAYTVDLFATQPVQGQGAPDSGQNFDGLYYQQDFDAVGVDLYWFHRTRGVGYSDDTFGTLLDGNLDVFSWSAELATQTGNHGPALSASGTAIALRGDLDVAEGVQLGLGYDYASGRSNGGDDGFVPLFNFSHAYQGHQDLVTWQNLQDIVVRSQFAVGQSWKLHGDVHFLSKVEDTDTVYFGSGAAGASAVTGAGTSTDIGTEADIYLKGAWTKNVAVWTGISQFYAGNALTNNDDQLWLFFQIAVNF